MLFYEILASLDIHLLAFGQCHVGREWNYRNVNSYYNRLILVLDGSVTVTHHGQRFELSAGSTLLVPCYTSANYICTGNGSKLYYLHFTSRALGGVDLCGIREYDYLREARKEDYSFFKQLHRLNPNRELPIRDPSENLYRLYHDRLQESYPEMSPQLHLENMAYISLILAPFLPLKTRKNASQTESQRMYEFVAYVEENLHRPLGLPEIADTLGVTPNYLSDWLFKTLRTRPVEYINRRRIEESQRLLVSTRKSIKEIADGLGFTSPTYFARVFRNQLGVTASRYRALHVSD
jgi:AraC-like DNA-binding protein